MNPKNQSSIPIFVWFEIIWIPHFFGQKNTSFSLWKNRGGDRGLVAGGQVEFLTAQWLHSLDGKPMGQETIGKSKGNYGKSEKKNYEKMGKWIGRSIS